MARSAWMRESGPSLQPPALSSLRGSASGRSARDERRASASDYPLSAIPFLVAGQFQRHDDARLIFEVRGSQSAAVKIRDQARDVQAES